MKNVLLIEDDPEIVRLLEIHLRDLNCKVVTAADGETGLRQAIAAPPDLIILDIMLPELDGIGVCQQLRAKQVDTPIIMLTAKSEEIDKVLGLEVGADDYLTKPFSVREFIARVKAIFRRQKLSERKGDPETPTKVLKYKDLTVDIDMRKVVRSGKRVELSPKEFELLVLMASNPGKSYDRSSLLNLIWGYDFKGYEHTVNSHINRLRSKLEPDMGNPTYILTTWGVGYKFNGEI